LQYSVFDALAAVLRPVDLVRCAAAPGYSHKTVAPVAGKCLFWPQRNTGDEADRMIPFLEPVTIKRYGHRRYDPNGGCHVTLADLAVMVEEQDFVVCEATTGEDVTRSVLKRIIIERAKHG
jgi:hypothetical protein